MKEFLKRKNIEISLRRYGIDALGEIIKIDPDAKVIMCSDQKYESMIMMALKKGAKDFVIKPFTSYDILLAVKKLFGE